MTTTSRIALLIDCDNVSHRAIEGVLEELAKMALYTYQINPDAKELDDTLIQKHYQRKHGPNAYYGQL